MENQQSVTYFEEISHMMYGLGDAYKSNPDTIRLVESIVLKQLRMIIHEASKYADGKRLRGEELVFLMRHDKHKMRRFVKQLHTKEEKKHVESMQHSNLGSWTQPKCPLLDFIESIDETGEFTDVSQVDPTRQVRNMRANEISIALDKTRYIEYQKARCVSFTSQGIKARAFEKLRTWVDPKDDYNFTVAALEVLAYYAYDTVAQIVDYAFLVRLDTKRGPDPLNNGRAYCVQQAFSVNEVKEVMRRVCSPHAGRLSFGRKLPETHYILAL